MQQRCGAARCMGSVMSIPTWLVFFGNSPSSSFFFINERLWMAEDVVMLDAMVVEEEPSDVAMQDAVVS